jgi:hypothetical protein
MKFPLRFDTSSRTLAKVKVIPPLGGAKITFLPTLRFRLAAVS